VPHFLPSKQPQEEFLCWNLPKVAKNTLASSTVYAVNHSSLTHEISGS